MKSPYSIAPKKAFWSKAISNEWNPASLCEEPLVSKNDRIMSAGSCFASNIVPYIEKAGIQYVRAEVRPPIFNVPPEAMGYDKFSAAYGNIYTARQMLQLLKRALGLFAPKEEFWVVDGKYIDPYRPGLNYKARSEKEFKILIKQHLECIMKALRNATVFVFTFGLTEAWISKIDGAVFPVCPGTISGTFDPEKHEFKNFTSSEIKDDMLEFIDLARTINPSLRFILTVSPVPLVATATNKHVLLATIYSKSALRVAAEETVMARNDIAYFPAYEIITGPQAPYEFFSSDRRNVEKEAIETVMSVFLHGVEGDGSKADTAQPDMQLKLQALSQNLAEVECEEAALDRI